jgi:holliday junction resolvase Hjr
MSLKSKGIQGERDLIHRFWGVGWAALRVAGSGSMQFPSPDLLVGNRVRVLAIECKITSDKSKYFEKAEIKDLRVFAEYFGAEPWVAVKFLRQGWFFLGIEDLEETEKSYVLSFERAKSLGLSFEELTSDLGSYGKSQG